MVDIVNSTLSLGENKTGNPFPLESRGPGTYRTKLAIRGNSLLSSVFVKSISAGATLKVNYWDTTTGTEQSPERYDLTSHDLITDTDAGTTFRITVPRIHFKPQIEAIVTGGTVEFGIHVTVVQTFVSDIDNALIRDGDTFVSTTNKAIPIACLDETTGELYFVRCTNGLLPTSGGAPGIPKQFTTTNGLETTPGTEQTIISETVPTGKIWHLIETDMMCRAFGSFKIEVAGTRVGSGRTGSHDNPMQKYTWNPYYDATAGQIVVVKYCGNTNSSKRALEGYLKLTEEDV